MIKRADFSCFKRAVLSQPLCSSPRLLGRATLLLFPFRACREQRVLRMLCRSGMQTGNVLLMRLCRILMR